MPNVRRGPQPGKQVANGRERNPTAARTRAIINKLAVSEEMTPLEVMLAIMRVYFAKRDYANALYAAEKAAPYIHPKLAQIEARLAGHDGGPMMPPALNINLVAAPTIDGEAENVES